MKTKIQSCKSPTTTTPTPAALTLCLLCAIAIAAGCGKPEQAKADPSSVVKSSFADARDGKEYRTVKIGKQVWMAENLNFVADSSWCYDNDDANCEKYGRLYNWDAAMGACPSEWRLPAHQDWDDLGQAVGGIRTLGNKGNIDWSGVGKKLKSKTGWSRTMWFFNGNGTDDFGFSALPGGNRFYLDGRFLNASYIGAWWSASEGSTTGTDHAWQRVMAHRYNPVNGLANNKSFGLSVRCLQN